MVQRKVPVETADQFPIDTPEEEVRGSPPAAPEPFFPSGDVLAFIQNLVDQGIQAAVGSAVEKAVAAQNETKLVEVDKLPVVEPPSWKKHYRNDVSPDIKIQKLDMSALDRNENPSKYPVPGKYIMFRRGHLYTNDDSVIRQIEYIKNRDKYAADGAETVGGNPAIYDDDGSKLFRCTAGCEFVSGSWEGFKAHMRATHGVKLG